MSGSGVKISLAGEGCAELTEKKSVFIGHAAPAESEDEALAFIDRIKAEYADATHNVWAYTLCGGSVARFSDDGEPHGTAGIPVLDVMRKSGIDDSVTVVTRYFGGILLGAGGLVRMYSAAAKAAIDDAGLAEWKMFVLFRLSLNYSDYKKFAYELPKAGVLIEKTEFADNVTLSLAVEKSQYDNAVKMITEMTNGKVVPEIIGEKSRASTTVNS